MATSLICEQGDMGLWANPLSDQDQKAYDQQKEKEDKETKADE